MSDLVLGVSVGQVSDTNLDSEFPFHFLGKWHSWLQNTSGNLCWLLLLGEKTGSRLRTKSYRKLCLCWFKSSFKIEHF